MAPKEKKQIPFEIGQTVHLITGNHIYSASVTGIWHCPHNNEFFITTPRYTFTDKAIGKTAFSTYSEAVAECEKQHSTR